MDLNMLDEDGTPLIVYASKEHKGEIVEWLLKNNANPDAQDKYGKTAPKEGGKGALRKYSRILHDSENSIYCDGYSFRSLHQRWSY